MAVLPAYAGMIPKSVVYAGRKSSAPRVCGDDPSSGNAKSRWLSCSPRMRG